MTASAKYPFGCVRSLRTRTFPFAEKNKHLDPDADISVLIGDDCLEDRFCNRDTAFAIHKILHAMAEPYKEVFSLRAFGELSFQQIAQLFGKTETWARVTYHRARLKIKEELK